MIEAEKHYVPKVEEFYPGFEYESSWGLKNINEEWHQETFESGDDPYDSPFNFVEYLLQEKKLRVKHLDQEDIESLGFEHHNYPLPDNNTMWYKKPIDDTFSYWIGHGAYNGKKETIIVKAQNPKTIFKDKNPSRFSGYIKNKSELKKILKQVGIE